MVTREDMACKCGCGFDVLDYELKIVIEDLECRYGLLSYHSGCRCYVHNFREGGADNSYHVRGKAVDFHIEGFELQEIYDYLDKKYKGKYEIIIYNTFIHIALQTYEERLDKR